MRRVLNLTGTVIHTNLGRALLADSALQHLLAMMAGPNNLEYDLDSGGRGDRDSIVEELLCTHHRRAGGDGGQQQRRRGAADDRRAGARHAK